MKLVCTPARWVFLSSIRLMPLSAFSCFHQTCLKWRWIQNNNLRLFSLGDFSCYFWAVTFLKVLVFMHQFSQTQQWKHELGKALTLLSLELSCERKVCTNLFHVPSHACVVTCNSSSADVTFLWQGTYPLLSSPLTFAQLRTWRYCGLSWRIDDDGVTMLKLYCACSSSRPGSGNNAALRRTQSVRDREAGRVVRLSSTKQIENTTQQVRNGCITELFCLMENQA